MPYFFIDIDCRGEIHGPTASGRSAYWPWERVRSKVVCLKDWKWMVRPFTFWFQDRPFSKTIHFQSFGPPCLTSMDRPRRWWCVHFWGKMYKKCSNKRSYFRDVSSNVLIKKSGSSCESSCISIGNKNTNTWIWFYGGWSDFFTF